MVCLFVTKLFILLLVFFICWFLLLRIWCGVKLFRGVYVRICFIIEI
ncbi:hypothetical protein HC081234_01610 [Helicobacter cinaedi]|nr:hypothetical protein HC081234_01610 [Helicobacter cinaedi]